MRSVCRMADPREAIGLNTQYETQSSFVTHLARILYING